MASGLVTNVEEVWEAFQQLTNREMTKAVKRAINKAAAILQRTTISNLSSLLKSDTGGKGRYIDKMTDAVRRSGANGMYDEEISAIVHIMGTQASSSGTFRARFFEKGTKERYAQTYKGQPLRKPRYIGQIRPNYYFKAANDQLSSQLDRIYAEEINKTIEKINASKEA